MTKKKKVKLITLEKSAQTAPVAYEWRTRRFALAMEKSGGSRASDLFAVAELAGSPGGSLLELMSGTGFVSEYIGGQFDYVDKSDLMAKFLSSDILACDASMLDNMTIRRKVYDVCVCLAGFHHLLPEESLSLEVEKIIDYRVETLSRWREITSPGGKVIIGDVPATSAPLEMIPPGEEELLAPYPALRDKFRTLPLDRIDCAALAERANPAMFFDNFVSVHSHTGHVGHFESAESLAVLMRSSGFSNVKSFVRFTPWVFPNRDIAVWFFHNLFGIGDKSNPSVTDPSTAYSELINQAIEKYLGIQEMKDGTCVVGWTFVYAAGEA